MTENSKSTDLAKMVVEVSNFRQFPDSIKQLHELQDEGIVAAIFSTLEGSGALKSVSS